MLTNPLTCYTTRISRGLAIEHVYTWQIYTFRNQEVCGNVDETEQSRHIHIIPARTIRTNRHLGIKTENKDAS